MGESRLPDSSKPARASTDASDAAHDQLADAVTCDTLQLGLLALRLGCCGRVLRDAMNDRLESSELNELEFLLLCLVAEGKFRERPQTELAEHMLLSPARLSSLIDRLRRRGLLEVIRDDRDRRRQSPALTADGRQHLSAALNRLESASASFASQFPPRRREDLHRLLTQLVQAVQQPQPHREAA